MRTTKEGKKHRKKKGQSVKYYDAVDGTLKKKKEKKKKKKGGQNKNPKSGSNRIWEKKGGENYQSR